MSKQVTALVNTLLEEVLTAESGSFEIEPLTPPQRGRKQLYQLTILGMTFTAFKDKKVEFHLWDWESVD